MPVYRVAAAGSAFLGADETPPFQFVAPKGWTIDVGPVKVTADNQSQFVLGNLTCHTKESEGCDCPIVKQLCENLGDEENANWAPKLGYWYVQAVVADDIVPVVIDPNSGTAHNLKTCANLGAVTATGKTGTDSWQPLSLGGGYGPLLLAGGAAVALYLLLRGRRNRPRRNPRRSRARRTRRRRR